MSEALTLSTSVALSGLSGLSGITGVRIMASPFLGQIAMFGVAVTPSGWSTCNGQSLLINDYPALFTILGTKFGGNGTTNFNLPDLRGRTTIHIKANTYSIGDSNGKENHQLVIAELPVHTHQAIGTADSANSSSPTNRILGGANAAAGGVFVNTSSPDIALKNDTISNIGSNTAHNNMQPSFVLSYYIALIGQAL